MIPKLLLLLVILLTSCKAPSTLKPLRPEILQTCQTCNTKWLVTPINPNTVIPPTIEWCYLDGNYCEIGFEMIKEAIRNNEDLDNNHNWLNHCLKCSNCRMAYFSPKEWKEVIDNIKEIRNP